jgi:hypothetical protein
MKRKSITIWVVVAILGFCLSETEGAVAFNDGQIHDIDYAIYDDVMIDDLQSMYPTTVNLNRGALIAGHVRVYGMSTITMFDDSWIAESINLYGTNEMEVSGGYIGQYVDAGVSTVTITGGIIDSYFIANGTVDMSGGEIAGVINIGAYGTMTIYGSGFNYPFGPIPDAAGTLTGTLLNGNPINNSFTIGPQAAIVLIPEPAMLLLIGRSRPGLSVRPLSARSC